MLAYKRAVQSASDLALRQPIHSNARYICHGASEPKRHGPHKRMHKRDTGRGHHGPKVKDNPIAADTLNSNTSEEMSLHIFQVFSTPQKVRGTVEITGLEQYHMNLRGYGRGDTPIFTTGFVETLARVRFHLPHETILGGVF